MPLLLAAALLAGLPAQDPGSWPDPPPEPVAQRLNEAWRWRDLPSDTLDPGTRRLRSLSHGPGLPEGGIAGLDSQGLFLYDGWTLRRLPLPEKEVPDFVFALEPAPDGVYLLQTTGAWHVPLDGPPQRFTHPLWHFTRRPPEAVLGDRVLVGWRGRLLALDRTGIQEAAQVPGHAPVLGLAAAVDGGLLVLTPEALWRWRPGVRDGEPWERQASREDFEAFGLPPLRDDDTCRMARVGATVFLGPSQAAAPWPGLLSLGPGGLSLHSPPAGWIGKLRELAPLSDGGLLAVDWRQQVLLLHKGRWWRLDPAAWGIERVRFLDCDGRRLVASDDRGRIRFCDLESRRWQSFLPEEPQQQVVHDLARAADGGLWLATDGGLIHWDGARFRPEGPPEVAQAMLTTVLEDREGRLWVGSGSRPDSVRVREDGRWRLPDGPPALRENPVHAIHQTSDGALWFSLLTRHRAEVGNGGLLRWKDGRWTEYLAGRDGLPSNHNFCLLETEDGILAGTRRGPAVLGPEGVWKALPGPAPPPEAFALASFGGSLWIGQGPNRRPVFTVDPEGRARPFPDASFGWILDFAVADGSLWAAGLNGLYRWDGQTLHSLSGEPHAPAASLWPVLPGRPGELWLGTLGDGLVRFRNEDRDPPRLLDLDQLLDEEGHLVLRAEAADLWERTPRNRLRYRFLLNGRRVGPIQTDPELHTEDPLPPGTHQVQVEVFDLAGNSRGPGMSFPVVVPPPPPPPLLERPEFLVPLAAVLGLLGWSASVLVRRRREAEAREEAQRRDLEARERHYRRLLEEAELFLVHFGLDGELRFVSSSVETLLGHSSEALQRRPELLAEAVHPEDRPVWETLAAARDRREPRSQEAEGRVRRADGSWVRLYGHQVPRLGPDGDVQGYDLVAMDLTARLDLEEDLRRSQARFRALLEVCNEGVWILDARGRTLFANDRLREWLDAGLEELSREAWTAFLGPQDRRSLEEALAGLGRSGSFRRQARLRAGTGEGRPVLLSASPLDPTPEGQAAGYLLLVSDLQGLEEAQRARMEAERLEGLNALAASLAHDLNNLLAGVRGAADLLHLEFRGEPRAERFLDEVSRHVADAAELCERLLEAAGDRGIEIRSALDLNRILHEEIQEFRKNGPPGLEIVADLVEGSLPLEGYGGRLRRALRQMLANAREALGATPGRVILRSGRDRLRAEDLEGAAGGAEARPGSFVWFEVEDTGPGIPAEILPRVLDPFVSSRGVGRGLGLAQVHNAVRSHGGLLRLWSRPGLGTRVRVWLPAAPRRARPAAGPPAGPETAGAG